MASFALERGERLAGSWTILLVALAALVLGLAAVAAPAAALGLVLAGAFVAVAFQSLAWGLALFVLVAFFDVIPALAGSGLTLSKGAGTILALSWLARIALRRGAVPLLVRDHPFIAYAALFLLGWTLLSSLWADDSGSALSGTFRLAQGIVLLFIVFTAVETRRDLRVVIGAYVVGATMTAVAGIVGGAGDEDLATGGDVGRISGGVGDANELAALLIPAITIAVFGLATAERAFTRWGLATATALCSLALFMTQSRGGLIAFGVTLLLAPFLAGPLRARAIAAVLVVVALGVTYFTFFAPPEAVARVTSFSGEGATGREEVWPVAWEVAQDNPFMGVGYDNFRVVEPQYALATRDVARLDIILDRPKAAHNTYLHLLSELGVIGFGLFAALLAGALAAAWAGIRHFTAERDLTASVLGRSLLLGAVGMLVAVTFISGQHEKHLWLVLALLPTLQTAALVAGRRANGDGRHYDAAVSEALVEQLERRVVERMDALLAEQERLSRRRAQLVAREQEIRERLRALDEAGVPSERVAPSAADALHLEEQVRELAERVRAVEAREAALADREHALAERVKTVTARERAVAERAAELAVAARDAEEAVVAPESATPAPAPAAFVPAAEPAPAVEAVSRALTASSPVANLDEIARRVDAVSDTVSREQLEEWRHYLLYLRDYSDAAGRLPQSFHALLDEVFGELLEQRDRLP